MPTKWAYPYTIKKKKRRSHFGQRLFCVLSYGKSKKINALKFTKLQGVYLYDKGENDELIHVIGISTTDLQVYFTIFIKKSKEFFKKFFYGEKINSFIQKMIKTNIITRFYSFFTVNNENIIKFDIGNKRTQHS